MVSGQSVLMQNLTLLSMSVRSIRPISSRLATASVTILDIGQTSSTVPRAASSRMSFWSYAESMP